MKAHTTNFKNTVKLLGRKLKGIITYDDVTLEDEIYSITPHYEGAILKSIMKQLDLELSVDIPIGTILNCQIGILVGNDYEMLNFGNYVVFNSKKQEDNKSYRITCYDKILYSMKDNEDLHITYPISIKNYLSRIASEIGLTVATTSFYNSDLMIQGELYAGLNYTYRDILDEIAQATGSIICLNENDEIIVKYPTQTNDTIDEEFLKDINVDFGQKYGPVNSIVLSRSAESDNVYLQDEESVEENGLTEIKIVDNQIMNFNDRSDYLEGILNALDGLYYYINDYSSTGILYYEVGDLYNVQVDNKTYQCLMLNDEIEVTTGIREQVYADMPSESITDYTKADKTDRRINQTYLIVDKQNQQIESVISTQTEQNQKIARVVQTVDELNSKISDIADITTSLETNTARLEFEKINESEPVRVVIRPIGVNISYLYPSPILHPSNNLYFKVRILRFENTDEETIVDYILPDDLLYYDADNYDEFILDYDAHTCIVNKKCKWNSDGTVGLLNTPRTDEYEYPTIPLTNGDYIVSLVNYNNAYLFARLMVQNIYTTQFATKAEVGSQISQTAQDINLSVNTKLSNYSTTTQMNSAIDLKANQITANVTNNYATKTELSSTEASLNSKIDETADRITLSVNSVEEKVETAQDTADTADSKASSAQTIANNATSLANTAQNTANNATNLANTAQSTANSINNNLTTNYYTKTETSSAIETKANQITSSVSETYSTKTETTQAKNEAINSANSSTDTKLQSYSTTTQMNSAITQKANEINSVVSTKVGNNEVISKINQSAEAVTIQASKLNINGAVSANGNFKVDTSGNMIATSATLTNAKIVSNANNSSITMQSGNVLTKDTRGNKGVEIVGQQINLYSYNDANNYIGSLGSKVTGDNYQVIELYADHGDGLYLGVKDTQGRVDTYIALNYKNSGYVAFARDIRIDYGRAIQFYDNSTMRGEIYLSTGGKIIVPLLYSDAPVFGYNVGGGHYEGTPVISSNSHILFSEWSGTALNFFVDSTYVGTLSDKRLKKDITEIDDRLIKAVAECKLYQFKADNRNGLMSVGIMAQDFQANCKKYGIKPEDYEIFKKITYNLNDKTEYYSIDYEQYLIIKNKYLEDKVKEQEDRLNRLEEKINGLYKNNVE